jgi:hypothetical protein
MERATRKFQRIFHRCKHTNYGGINITNSFTNWNVLWRNISSLILYLLLISWVIFIPMNIMMNYCCRSLKTRSINICCQISWILARWQMSVSPMIFLIYKSLTTCYVDNSIGCGIIDEILMNISYGNISVSLMFFFLLIYHLRYIMLVILSGWIKIIN